MQTRTAKKNREIIPEIIRHLEAGEVIILPTDTTYALVAHAFNQEAIVQIPKLKYWDAPQPLALFTRKEKADEVVVVSPALRRMMEHFPYPITALVPAKNTLPQELTNGFKDVCVVCPDRFIYDLIEAVPFPMACAPASVYSDLIVTDFKVAMQFFDGKVPLIVDGGKSKYSRSGTLIDFSLEIPTILRFGPISFDDLKPLIPEIVLPSHLRK